MGDRELSAIADSDKGREQKGAGLNKITSIGGHVSGGTGVKKSIVGIRRGGGDASGAEASVQCLHVPGLCTRGGGILGRRGEWRCRELVGRHCW